MTLDIIQGTFVVDSRFSKLCDRLQKYYADTPSSMSNKEAIHHWRLFKQWCDDHGFINDDIQRAKKARFYEMK